MPSADAVLFPHAAILLSVAGLQHGPHFDPVGVAILATVAIGTTLAIFLSIGAALGCAAAALIRGVSFGKGALLGMGMTTGAAVACIVSTIVFSPSFYTYTVTILAAVVILVVLVHRSGDPSPGKRALIGIGAIIGIGIACSGFSYIPGPSSLLEALTIILAATAVAAVVVHRIVLNSPGQ